MSTKNFVSNGDAETLFTGIGNKLSTLKSGLTNLDNEVNGDATTYPYADVITIEDAVPANLADCNVKIEPVQDLHGQSAPYVGGAGKNILPLNGSTQERDGIKFTILKDDANNVIGYSIVGTATVYTSFSIGTVTLKAGNYILNGKPNDGNNNYWLNVMGTAWSDNGTGYNISILSDRESTVTVVFNEGAVVNTIIYPMIRLATETDPTFAPYTNICPISGHTETSVLRDGVNLCDTATFTSYAAERIVNLNGVKVTPGTYTASFNVTALPSSDYRVEFCECSVATQTQGTSVAGYITGTTVTANSTGRKNVSLTVTEEGYLYIRCVPAGFSLSDIQIEKGETATPYEPYAGKTYTIALGDTIYGGKVRIDSNGNTVMDVDRATKTFNGSESWLIQEKTHNYFNTQAAMASDVKASSTLLANEFEDVVITGSNEVIGIHLSDTNKLQIRYALDNNLTVSDLQTFLGQNPLQVCYELATPTTIQLTPQQIQLLKGTNTLTASTGQISVTVNGVSGSIGAVQEQVNATDEALTELAENYEDVIGWSERINLFDKNAKNTANGYVDGKSLSNDGAENTNSGFAISEYIPIKAGRNYTMQALTGNQTSVCVYTKNKTFIEGWGYYSQSIKTIKAPENGAYLRFTITKANVDITQLEESDTATPYVQYHPVIGTAVEELLDKVPDAPSTDGTYSLQVTVSSGTPTYSWESAT